MHPARLTRIVGFTTATIVMAAALLHGPAVLAQKPTPPKPATVNRLDLLRWWTAA